MMLVEGTEQGTIPEEEHDLIQHVFDFNDITVEKICTHRPDIVWLSLDDDSSVWGKDHQGKPSYPLSHLPGKSG